MDKVYLQEAFRALDILNEEDFNLSSVEGAKELKDFIEDDEEKISFEDIIDPEAETEEELKDDYIGNVVLDCCVCHSKIYKNPEDVEIDEEQELANIDEECPFCYSTDGYKIVGQIVPYKEESEEEIEVKVDDEPAEVEEKEIEEEEEIEESLTESITSDLSEYQKWVDYDMGKYHRISNLTMRKIKNAGLSVVKDQYGDYEVIADRKDESLKEHFEKVEIETDREKMEMTSEPDGTTTIVTEPKEEFDYADETAEEEVIAPVSDEVQTEINDVVEEPEEETVEEAPLEDTEVDMDVEEVSEEEVDELGESYLKRVYENVDSFKTSKVKINEGKLIIEGIIKFNSGKQKKTSFIFESKDIDKNGTARFIGENVQMSKGKKAFTLKGNLNNGKFIAESLNYNYRTKDSKGNSTRLYGTVKVSK